MITGVLRNILFFGFCLGALALPHHIIVPSIKSSDPTTSACVYPDGSSPANRPELHCYAPEQFLRAYGIDKLHAEGLTGKGQTIILVDSFGSPTMQADLDHFSDTFALPHTTIEYVYPNGEYVNPLETDDQVGWAQETTLDVEWAHAIAPDAKLVNVISNNAETTGLTGFPDLFTGIQMAAQKYPNGIVSMSFGTGEPTFNADDIKNFLQGSFHQILADASAGGMTLLASSGDSGSTNLNLAQDSLIDSPNASYPATDSFITAVGGTALEDGWNWAPTGTADNYWTCKLQGQSDCPFDFLRAIDAPTSRKESVWKEDWALAAGGGGVSQIFSADTYQALLTPQVLAITKGQRAIPDISLNAAINGGVDVYTSFKTGPTWQSFGGTSCSSPETAAIVALAGQKASEVLKQTVGIGFLNPILYSLDKGNFRDILPQALGATGGVTIDNNALYFNADVLAKIGPTRVPPVAVPGYLTTHGYDLATGLGTPRADKFVHDLASARVLREFAHSTTGPN